MHAHNRIAIVVRVNPRGENLLVKMSLLICILQFLVVQAVFLLGEKEQENRCLTFKVSWKHRRVP